MDAVTITLPLPDAALHAHAKGHWRAKAGPTRAMRDLAGYLALEASGGRRPRWGKAVLSVAIYFGNRRRRDALNVMQGLKPAIDGMVDAGVIVDDCWSVLSVGEITADVDKDRPRVEMTVRRNGRAEA